MGRHNHNKTIIAINRALLSGIFRGLGALPWPILRGISSIIAFLAHRVVRYRIRLCRENISSSFPEMSEQVGDGSGFFPPGIESLESGVPHQVSGH